MSADAKRPVAKREEKISQQDLELLAVMNVLERMELFENDNWDVIEKMEDMEEEK